MQNAMLPKVIMTDEINSMLQLGIAPWNSSFNGIQFAPLSSSSFPLSTSECNVSKHRYAYTVLNERVYVCMLCQAITMNSRSALYHFQGRKEDICPESKWPTKYRMGMEEYTKRRKKLVEELKRGKRSMGQHQIKKNALMHEYIIR